MIDIHNYKRAIEWLKRSSTEHAAQPQSTLVQDAVSQSFVVTYNTTEEVLQEALSTVCRDGKLARLSAPELMRYPSDEGLGVCSARAWLEYGLAIERTQASLGNSFRHDLQPLLAQYVKDLDRFVTGLDRRLVPVA